MPSDIGDGNKPFRWTPGVGHVKLTSCCGNGLGADINASGAIAGSLEAGPNNAYRGFVATGNSITVLPILPNVPFDNQEEHAKAIAINDAGDIVGYSPTTLFSTRHAVRWTAAGGMLDLGTLGGANSEAVDVNNAGQVIGMSQVTGNGATHAFLWSAGVGMQDLNALADANITSVVEINDAGQIIGTYTAPNGQSHAFRYAPVAGLLDLGTLGGSSSTPTGMNGRGEVVGSSTLADGSTHAFLWTPADGLEDITARSGVTEVRRLNDNLQTLTVTAAPGATPSISSSTSIPRLVQLQVTQSNAPPTAVFTWTCNGLTCTLDASGSLDDKPGLTYSWDLNKYPDNLATGAVVNVTYPDASSRSPTLTVTDAQGLTSTATQTFAVSDYPYAVLTYNCFALTCSFSSNGSTNDGNPYTPSWYFGDGQSAYDAPSPSHTYAQPGTYAVKLEVVSYSPFTVATVVAQVTVSVPPPDQPPVASFTWRCVDLKCFFDASASTDDFGIVDYRWTWGKSPYNNGQGMTPSTSYPAPGPRTVTLTVTDADGFTGTQTQTIDVGTTTPPPNQAPVASFTWSCPQLTCSFDASASADDKGIVSYKWTWGKTPYNNGSGMTPSTSYPAPGPRTVTLTVTDAEGLTGTQTQTITVGSTQPPADAPPVASFTWSCPTLRCYFDASASTDDVGIVSYAWTWGKPQYNNGSGVTTNTPYPSSGPRTVTLTVTDTKGQTNSVTQTVVVP